MQEQTFRDAIEVIYSTFGRSSPSGAIAGAIRDRVRHIPDEAVPWIVAKICDEATIPQNVGRAIVREWDAWQLAHPQRVVKNQCPAGCDGGVRHYWLPKDGRWMHFVFMCPACAESIAQNVLSGGISHAV